MSNFLAILILTYISICCSKISLKMHIKLSVSILLFCFFVVVVVVVALKQKLSKVTMTPPYFRI